MRRTFISILSIGLMLFGCDQTKSEQEQSAPTSQVEIPIVRLATWNLENLFDDIDDPYNDEILSPEEYQRKLKQLSRIIQEIQPTILAVQEVENIQALEDLAAMAFPQESHPQVVLIEGNDQSRGIDVGLISVLPIKETISHQQDPLKIPNSREGYHFSRDCLEVRLDLPNGQPVAILVNHFKSKRGKRDVSDNKRKAQADRVAEIVNENQRYNIPSIVVGDLNDTPDSWPLRSLIQSDNLEDPFHNLSLKERHTFRYRGKKEIIDYIFIHPALSQYVIRGSQRVYGSARGAASDHAPMSLDFRTTTP